MPKKKRGGQSRPRPGAILLMILALGILALWLFLPQGSLSPRSPYALRFSPDFPSALASRDELGISVVVAVDCSGSMSSPPASGGEPKYVQATAALARVAEVVGRIAESAPPGQVLKVGVIRFSDELKPLLPLEAMDAEGLARLAALAADPRAFQPSGNTAIGLALERGAEWLAQSGTILRSLIVVTDGENTDGVEPEPVLEALYANRNSASSEELPVFTNSTLVSFIGFDIEAGRFRGLAELGARLASASDGEELAATISGILEADVTRLEAPEDDTGGRP